MGQPVERRDLLRKYKGSATVVNKRIQEEAKEAARQRDEAAKHDVHGDVRH